MKKKWLAIGIILLFVGGTIAPTMAQNTEKSQTTSRGNWLYVGGSGPGNYSRIQDAINDSSPGDTVYVYNGTYHETLSINVTDFSIIGEGREITIIDANSTTAVTIQQSNVNIQGFTILAGNENNGTNGIYISKYSENVKICCNNFSKTLRGVNIDYLNRNHIIENNIFYSHLFGIFIYYDEYLTIRNNTFILDYEGISFDFGQNNEILNNKFLDCNEGVYLLCDDSTIRGNVFIGNDCGISIHDSNHNIIGNHFENNDIGLYLNYPSNVVIHDNNFINNIRHAKFFEQSFSNEESWDGNYWERPRICPKPLLHIGIFWILEPGWYTPGLPLYYPWFVFDWHPAQEPYDVLGMS